jgi:peptide/nickel transport system substrate-binding protein
MIHRSLLIAFFSLLMLAVTSVAAQEMVYGEAPDLAARVAAGELPPVAERLPVDPLVLDYGEIGVYGGEWTMGMEGTDDNPLILKTVLYDGLVRWDREWNQVIPNLAASWDIEGEGTKYTFNLRQGVQWSDGTPFTSADIMFWVDNVVGNEEIDRSFPRFMRIADESPTVTAPDEYTVVFEWPVPHGTFLQELAAPQGLEVTWYQAGYSQQFHADFNPDIDTLVAEGGFDGWLDLWEARVEFSNSGINPRNQNPELPSLMAWLFTTPLGEGEQVTLVRNPYYWKVDAAGNQLPYIDEVTFRSVSDRETLRLQAAAGEWDMQDRRLGGYSYAELYAGSAEQGNYRLFRTISGNNNDRVISFNLNHRDPVKNEIYNTRDFRVALSIAINRDEINEVAAFGLSRPFQAAPRPESPLYDEEFATQYTEYDPARAEEILDGLGYTRNAEGFRVGPDGEPIIINITTDVERGYDELIIGYWVAIGIQATITVQDRSLFREVTDNNDHDTIFRAAGDGGLGADVYLAPRWYHPSQQESMFGIAWFYWLYDREDFPDIATEPPAPVLRQAELLEQLRMTADAEQQLELMREVLQIAKEEFFVIGTILAPDEIGVIANDFYNVFPVGAEEVMFSAFNWPQPAPLAPEQFFIRPA